MAPTLVQLFLLGHKKLNQLPVTVHVAKRCRCQGEPGVFICGTHSQAAYAAWLPASLSALFPSSKMSWTTEPLQIKLQGCSVNEVWSTLKGGHGSWFFVLGGFFCPMRVLNFPPGIKLVPPVVAMWSLNHWIPGKSTAPSFDGALRFKFIGLLIKQSFTAWLFLHTSKAVGGLSLTEPPSSRLLEGQCLHRCGFLIINKRLLCQILLQVLLKCVPTYARVASCWIFFVSLRTECSLLHQQHFPHTHSGKAFRPSQQGSKVLTGALQK